VITIWLPPLRMRQADVARLTEHFLAKHGGARAMVSLSSEAMLLIQEQSWPGNVRQLENFVERLVALSDGPDLDERDVRRELARPANPFATEAPASPAEQRSLPSMDTQRRAAEKSALEAALTGAAGNRSAAARILGISRRTLYKKLNEHSLG
jgi:two-component system response regulator AtoC